MLSLIFNRGGALSSRGAHSSKYGKQKKKIDEDAVATNFCFSKEKKKERKLPSRSVNALKEVNIPESILKLSTLV